MKLRNLISAALLVGVGSTALTAAATFRTDYPIDLPSNCRFTMVGAMLPLDIRGDTGHSQTYFIVSCTAPQPPSWLRW